MKQRRLGRSGIHVSELCLGAMNFANPRFGVGEKESLEVVAAYLDRGGNFIDTADAYTGGESERVVAKALAGRRERVILATKAFFPVVHALGEPPAHVNAHGASRRHLALALEDSLRRLETDWIDLYQVHCWDASTPLEETLSALDDFVRQGKVRYVGLSNYSAWQIVEAAMRQAHGGLAPFVTAQMQYSLICRELEHEVIPVLDRFGLGLLAWSPLGQGVLTGKYRAGRGGAPGTRFAGEPANAAAADWRGHFLNPQALAVAEKVAEVAARLEASPAAVALSWLLRRPAVSSVIIGPKSVSQLDENLAGAALELPAAERASLDAPSESPPRYPEWFIARMQRR